MYLIFLLLWICVHSQRIQPIPNFKFDLQHLGLNSLQGPISSQTRLCVGYVLRRDLGNYSVRWQLPNGGTQSLKFGTWAEFSASVHIFYSNSKIMKMIDYKVARNCTSLEVPALHSFMQLWKQGITDTVYLLSIGLISNTMYIFFNLFWIPNWWHYHICLSLFKYILYYIPFQI